MTKPRVALIVGAGFSREADLPSTDRVTEKFLERPSRSQLPEAVDTAITSSLRRFWEVVFGFSGGKRPSLDDHFTVIDLAANSGHHLGSYYSPKRLRAIRRLSIHRVFQILDSSYQASDRIKRFLDALQRRTKLAIICLNWDVVIEKHLYGAGSPYDYVVEVEPLDQGSALHKGVRLLKLHGSANWVYCDSCRRLFAGPPDEGKTALHRSAYLEADDFKALECEPDVVAAVETLTSGERSCPRCTNRFAARLATFSYRKAFSIHQFQTIWERAHATLRDADHWLFIGYSMPHADFEFRHLLKAAQLGRRRASAWSATTVLMGDADGAPDRYRQFFGLSFDDRIRTCGFAHWADSHLDNWLTSIRGVGGH